MTNKHWLEHYDPEVPDELKYPLVPAHQILKNTAFFSPHSEAIHEPGKETYTYLDLYREAKRVANTLIGNGLQKGDRVVMSLPNSRTKEDWLLPHRLLPGDRDYLTLGGYIPRINGSGSPVAVI